MLLLFSFSFLVSQVVAFGLCVCSTTLMKDDLSRMEQNIPFIMCKLERIFPPGFFDSTEHLPIHLAYEARLGGSVQYR